MILFKKKKVSTPTQMFSLWRDFGFWWLFQCVFLKHQIKKGNKQTKKSYCTTTTPLTLKIPALGSLMQEDCHELAASLGCTTKPCLWRNKRYLVISSISLYTMEDFLIKSQFSPCQLLFPTQDILRWIILCLRPQCQHLLQQRWGLGTCGHSRVL